MKVSKTISIAFMTFCLQSGTIETRFTGLVTDVTDGDTITVRNGQSEEKVRLADIDCPEKKQEFGSEAKKFCTDLCIGKTVQVQGKERDQNKRLLATVYLSDGTNLNEELVKAGMAWCYRPHCKDSHLLIVERYARDSHIGIWRHSNPIAPWEWRKMNKQKREMLSRCRLKLK